MDNNTSIRFAREGAPVVIADRVIRVNAVEPGTIATELAAKAGLTSYVTGEIVTIDGGRMALNHTVPV